LRTQEIKEMKRRARDLKETVIVPLVSCSARTRRDNSYEDCSNCKSTAITIILSTRDKIIIRMIRIIRQGV